MAATKMAALTWPEVVRQLNNPREKQRLLNFLDSEDVNKIRIRGAFLKRKKRQLRRMSKATSLQEESDNQVDTTGSRAWRSNPSIPTSDAEQFKDKDYLQVKDNAAWHRRKSIEKKKSKMAFDEKQDADSLLPSLEDGSRPAKGSTDIDMTSNSSRQNNEKLPPIDENQLVTRNKELHQEKVHINSVENRNPSDDRKRIENSPSKISSLGNSSNSDKDGDESTNPQEESQKSEKKSLNGKDKKHTATSYAENNKKDNRTEQRKNSNQPQEPGTDTRGLVKKQPKRRSLDGHAGFKSSFADKEMDQLVIKLERVVNRNLRALQGMKPEDTDDEEELDQKTIDRFIDGDRKKEIDEYLLS